MSSPQDCVECQTDNGSQPSEQPVVTEQQQQQDSEAAQEIKNKAPVAVDPLNPATFVPPSPLPTPNITVEFCDRVRRRSIARNL